MREIGARRMIRFIQPAEHPRLSWGGAGNSLRLARRSSRGFRFGAGSGVPGNHGMRYQGIRSPSIFRIFEAYIRRRLRKINES